MNWAGSVGESNQKGALMKGKTRLPISYVAGSIYFSDCVAVLARMDEIEERGGGFTKILTLRRLQRRAGSYAVEWDAIRVCATGEPHAIYAVDVTGRFVAIVDRKLSEESIWPGPEGPEVLGDIRDLRLIGGCLYAAGMNRQVYRREGPGQWSRRDAGMVICPPSTEDVTGFNSIDGLAERDLYAAGFGGEIWRYDGMRWQPIGSPTNLVLNRVRAVKPELVYICGKKGTILRGHADRWEVVDQADTEDELWDVEVFNEQIYFASTNNLYRLAGDDSLEPVKVGLTGNITYGSLHARDGVLLSVGRTAVIWTPDGKTWHDITE